MTCLFILPPPRDVAPPGVWDYLLLCSPSVAPTVAALSDPARSTRVRRDEMTSEGDASGLLSM